MNRLRKVLRAPAVRFGISGGVVAIVALTITAGLHATGLPFQVAFLVSFTLGTALHFGLHRHFTFEREGHAYDLSGRHQLTRFGALVVAQYVTITGGVALLTPLLGLPPLAVYVGILATLSVVNFVVLASRIFHPRHSDLSSAPR